MVKIPERGDPTLDAIDRILEAKTNSEPKRRYIGASSIGDPCARKLWYRYHTDMREVFDAPTIRRFNDGHRTEDVMAAHLRMVPGIELYTHKDGRQYGFSYGAIKGHYDGVIRGLIQAPTTWHIWEHKAVNEKKFNEALKLRHDDEKTALKKWDEVYYAQAIINMHMEGLERHYMTISTPGMREYTSFRTEADPVFAMALLNKGERIANMKEPPERIGGPDWWQCKWCAFYDECQK